MPLAIDTDAIYRAVLAVTGDRFVGMTLPDEFKPKESSVFRSTGKVWRVKLTAVRQVDGASEVHWSTIEDKAIQDLIDAHGADLAAHLMWGMVKRSLQNWELPPAPTTPPTPTFR